MNSAELRASFRDFTGPDRYRKFMRTLNWRCRRKGRLFFWQEELWGEFVAAVPEAPVVEKIIFEVFCICDVHGEDLRTPPADDSPSETRDTPEYNHAFDMLFPFATGRELVCHQCQARRQQWILENLDLCRILRCQTTYEAYCDRLLDGLIDQTAKDRLKLEAKDRIKKRAAEITAQMQPGDELWEWDGGGWHRFAGRGGIAIVRGGNIVIKWCEVKS